MPQTPIPDWHRAHGEPLFTAQLRSAPEDFRVTECLGWEPSGGGEHDFLLIDKTGANTEWVARQIARHAAVPAREVGYAGLKDRHAITRQRFSVPRWHAPEWGDFDAEGVRVVAVTRHRRKLRRGAHRANRFEIVLRHSQAPDREAVRHRLAMIGEQGVPNYFGEQRFGRGGSNLRLAEDWARGKRLPRQKRGLAISVVRAIAFNDALAARVAAGTWDRFVAGDRANLDGSASVFDVTDIDEELQRRGEAMDIHPAGTLPGEGAAIAPPHWQAALDRARVRPDTRRLRLPVRDLGTGITPSAISLCFTLDRGSFATAVLRELCRWT